MKQGWEIKKLGEVCSITMGQSPSSDTYNDSEGLPFFQGNADFGKIHPSIRVYCNAPIRIADVDDILISVRAPIGAINIADCKCCIGRGLASIRNNAEVANEYIYHALIANKEKLIAQGTGSTFKSIGKEALKELSIPVPPRDEQERIVKELDCLSGVIEKKREQLRELDALAQSIFYTMFSDPITDEKGWEVKKWEDVFNTRTGKLNANVMNKNGKYPFFTCSKDIFYIDTYAFDCEALLLAGNNATANYDVKYYKGKFNAYQRTYVLTLKDNSLHKFFKFALENKLSLLQEQSIGGMTKYLTLGILHKIEFIVPPLALQQEFADKIEAIEKQKALIKQSITQTEELFNARMAYYFN